MKANRGAGETCQHLSFCFLLVNFKVFGNYFNRKKNALLFFFSRMMSFSSGCSVCVCSYMYNSGSGGGFGQLPALFVYVSLED